MHPLEKHAVRGLALRAVDCFALLYFLGIGTELVQVKAQICPENQNQKTGLSIPITLRMSADPISGGEEALTAASAPLPSSSPVVAEKKSEDIKGLQEQENQSANRSAETNQIANAVERSQKIKTLQDKITAKALFMSALRNRIILMRHQAELCKLEDELRQLKEGKD